ncbi:MAG: alpha/beta hydrolase, partial [Actinomycetes bacterium]
MTLHPQAQVLLDMLNAAPGPTPEELTPALLREQYAALAMPAAVEGVDREDRTIPGPGGPLAIRIYRPVGGGVTPGIVFFHGGGWVIGDLETHDGGCAALAVASRCTLVAVDYRLAPEHPFPAPVEDCCAATAWVAEHAAEIGIDADRLAVAGDSAGGNLAAVVAQIARDLGEPTIRFQLLVYPVTDYEFTSRSMVDNADGY